MSDYIKRDDLLKEVEELNAVSFYELNDHSNEAYHEIKSLIELVPAADVVEQRTGKWIIDETESASWFCSECGKHAYGCFSEIYSGEYHYCPNCGAKMESK